VGRDSSPHLSTYLLRSRLQTLDHGAPVSLYTVSRELGHGSEEMVRRVYSHLGTVRHRSEVVEYQESRVDDIWWIRHRWGSRFAPVLVRSAACSLATAHVAPDTAPAAFKAVG
jgi:hypothetical protein